MQIFSRFSILVIFTLLVYSCNKIPGSSKSTMITKIDKASNHIDTLLDNMVNESLHKLKKPDIFTFGFYHDHESDAISICIDTELNSEKQVKSTNEFTKNEFIKILNDGDLETLKLWNIQTGRNFSIGDFTYTNIVYYKINEIDINASLYYKMIKCIERNKSRIISFSKHPNKIVFFCSSADNEVEYIWQ